MIQLKILTRQEEKDLGITSLPGIILEMEQVLGYTLERTSQYDPNFEGYYLMSSLDYLIHPDLFTKETAKKIFLLGLVNSEISNALDEFEAIGLVQFRLFGKTKRTIHGKNSIVKKYNMQQNARKDGENYSFIRFMEFDGQENALAQAIIKYLTLHDELTEEAL